ncbi:hypothetical protein GGX14DRAFT_57091 [Mycena pura]|uniref:Uncharacterized protein n=1 Tax=Mycena pura TaxID=153505 RepID=A0AAD6XZC2_9AGAR|nr:hypothetical protein GGX14DRAFT_57091 [Mycena pura]
MFFYADLNHQIRQQIVCHGRIRSRRREADPCPDYQTTVGHSTLASNVSRTVASLPVLLLRILHTGRLLDPDGSYLSSQLSFPAIRYALDLSWESMRAAMCSLRPIFNEDPVEVEALLNALPHLCAGLDSDVSRQLARACIRLCLKGDKSDLLIRSVNSFLFSTRTFLSFTVFRGDGGRSSDVVRPQIPQSYLHFANSFRGGLKRMDYHCIQTQWSFMMFYNGSRHLPIDSDRPN